MSWRSNAFLAAFMFLVATHPSEGQQDVSRDLTSLTREQREFAVRTVVRHLVDEASSVARNRYDLEELANRIGPDSYSLFLWVRQNTTLVPYQGTLRGPEGVLIDRMGNSLDRTLLLARLLEMNGYTARVVGAELDLSQAEEVFEESLRTSLTPVTSIEEPDISSFETVLAEKLGANGRAFSRMLQTIARNRSRAIAVSEERLAAVSPKVLEAALSSTRETAEKRRSDELSQQILDLQRHWWLQYRRGSEWIDADLTLPEIGRRRAPVSRAFSPTECPTSALVGQIGVLEEGRIFGSS